MANYPQLNKEVQQGEIKVVMHTNKGDMTFKLFPNIAPKTVENFGHMQKMVIMMESHSTVSLMTS
ncbi:Peptidyl-prolyl cis-trans isomerase [Staphylococcus aureus]|nr:Peptidyl-prolyl cis-trans isomerase [Staphylococcus aureus]